MRKALTSLVLVLLALGAALLSPLPWPRPLLPARLTSPPTADAIKTWGLQLQNVLPLAIPQAVDLIVVDYSRDGSDMGALTPARVDELRRGGTSGRRIVLCYVSVGEAESYRYYWKKRWRDLPPAWLGPENKTWKGNYAVRYWHEDWQRLIIDPEPSVGTRLLEWLGLRQKPYLDRIIEAGFDGIYVDRVDAYDDWQRERDHDAAQADMAAFVKRIAATARARKPGFLVVPQNGEELLSQPGYVEAIDGAAKEDLLFGVDGEEKPNDPEAVAASTGLLDQVRSRGKPVLVVEYLADGPRRAEAAHRILKAGYTPLFAARALSAPPEPPPTRAEIEAAAGVARAAPADVGQPPGAASRDNEGAVPAGNDTAPPKGSARPGEVR